MKKLNLSPLVAAGVAAAVQINHDQAVAGTVTFTNETLFNNGSAITVPISPAIANADELISISAGSADGESSTFQVLVDYTGGSQQQIYSTTLHLSPIQFDTIPEEAFTEGAIDGLTFENSNGNSLTQSVPVGTIFTFDVAAPEPATLALAAVGAGGLWLAARRRAGQKG